MVIIFWKLTKLKITKYRRSRYYYIHVKNILTLKENTTTGWEIKDSRMEVVDSGTVTRSTWWSRGNVYTVVVVFKSQGVGLNSVVNNSIKKKIC